MRGDPASQELRRGIILRLALFFAVMIAAALAWQALGPSDHSAVPDAPGVGSQAAIVSGPMKIDPVAEPRSPRIDDDKPPTTVPDAQALSPQASSDSAMPLAASEPLKWEAAGAAHSEGMIRTLAVSGSEKSTAESSEPSASALPPIAQRKLPKGAYLQVGVFTHPANAAELKARLEAEGVPVVMATRVQVGPFKNKKEAEEMREKLKAIGVESRPINQ